MEWFKLLFPNYWFLAFVRDDGEHGQLLDKVKKLELELSQMKSELLTGESMKTSCEKIDVIHEKVGSVTVPVKLGTTWSLTFLKCTVLSNVGVVFICKNGSFLCSGTVNFFPLVHNALLDRSSWLVFLQWQGFLRLTCDAIALLYTVLCCSHRCILLTHRNVEKKLM